LTEVPPGIGVKDTLNPDVSIYVFEQITVADFVTFLRNKYDSFIQQELKFGEYNSTILQWIQQEGTISKIIVFENSKFLYVIDTDINSLLTKEILSQFKQLR
jgi:hypothetical protein